MIKHWIVGATMALVSMNLGCGTLVPASVVETTPGVSIRGDRLKIEANKPFLPPFWLEKWQFLPDERLPDSYKSWLERGATRVMVTVPEHPPLHGVLTFHRLPLSARGPGTRSYSLTVPEQYVRDASDGRISVVFELVSTEGGEKYFGWVLWLSDRPL